VRVVPLADPEAVNSILHHPAIVAKLRHDGRDPGYINHPLVSYHGAYVGDAPVGVFTAVRFSPWEVEVHVAILSSAIRHARRLCWLFLAQVFADSDVMRVTAYVLGTLPSAANLCRKLGFADEGRRRDACRVHGEPVDVLILGLTRADWSESCLHPDSISGISQLPA
jgi:hypothetical protein